MQVFSSSYDEKQPNNNVDFLHFLHDNAQSNVGEAI